MSALTSPESGRSQGPPQSGIGMEGVEEVLSRELQDELLEFGRRGLLILGHKEFGAETSISDGATPTARRIAVVAPHRALRDSDQGCSEDDLSFIILFIDKVIRLLQNLRDENLDDSALAYVRKTIKEYRVVRPTYATPRQPRGNNGKGRGDNWAKTPRDRLFKPSRVPGGHTGLRKGKGL